MDSEKTKIPARLQSSEGAVNRRRIVSYAGQLMQKHPDKFRVVHFSAEGGQPALGVETVLVYEDGELLMELMAEGKGGQLEQKLQIFDGSGPGRDC